MITIDILDRAYAKKLFKGLSSGYKSSTVTDNADGSKTLTINFVNGDKADITFNPVKAIKNDLKENKINKKEDLRRRKIETALENIENYNGTGLGQKEIPKD